MRQNLSIIQNADLVLAFWNGTSRGTKFVIDHYKIQGIPVKVFMPEK